MPRRRVRVVFLILVVPVIASLLYIGHSKMQGKVEHHSASIASTLTIDTGGPALRMEFVRATMPGHDGNFDQQASIPDRIGQHG